MFSGFSRLDSHAARNAACVISQSGVCQRVEKPRTSSISNCNHGSEQINNEKHVDKKERSVFLTSAEAFDKQSSTHGCWQRLWPLSKNHFPPGLLGLYVLEMADCRCLCALVSGVVVCIFCNKNHNCRFFFSLFVFVGLENVPPGTTAQYWALNVPRANAPPSFLLSEDIFLLCFTRHSSPDQTDAEATYSSDICLPFFQTCLSNIWNGNSQRRS